MEEYYIACSQVLYVLDNFLNKDDYLKISNEKLKLIKECANKKTNLIMEDKKSLDELDLSIKAKSILLNIFLEDFANEKQKERILNYIDSIEQKEERKKETLYNIDIFNREDKVNTKIENKVDNINQVNLQSNSQNSLVKTNWFLNVISNIKNWFRQIIRKKY